MNAAVLITERRNKFWNCFLNSKNLVNLKSISHSLGLNQAEDKKAKKILVHYGHKAKELGVKFTMMKGCDANPGALICKAAQNYNITNIVLGRRTLGSVERFIVGSTSKYIFHLISFTLSAYNYCVSCFLFLVDMFLKTRTSMLSLSRKNLVVLRNMPRNFKLSKLRKKVIFPPLFPDTFAIWYYYFPFESISYVAFI